MDFSKCDSIRFQPRKKIWNFIYWLLQPKLNYFFSGFLNANGSPLTRGQVANYGLMDQMAVLQWVQENSIQFGGDPQRVTLVGHGTGAACIEYLTHSPTTVPGKNFNQQTRF